ncbi:hypothetical protein [Rhodococcus sp. JT-3]|uniref:hypothetical protein n=1 Tax=Rhodococcus sp. JT-3 TaxID=1973213 RepID=UPI0013032192|nr:hypothetical protein [Rhodococcus sp. JT-3]
MRFPGLVVGFVPWVFYLVMPHPLGGGALVYASVIATVVAIALTLWTRARSGAKLLEVSAAVTFAALTVAVLVGGEPVRDWMRVYSPAAVLWVLAAVMVLSVLTVPFTEWYARQSLPQSYWCSPHLRSINRRISMVWSGCTLAAAVSVSAAAIAHRNGGAAAQYLTLSLTWVLPLVLALAAYRYTERAANTRTGRAAT